MSWLLTTWWGGFLSGGGLGLLALWLQAHWWRRRLARLREADAAGWQVDGFPTPRGLNRQVPRSWPRSRNWFSARPGAPKED